MEYAIPLAALAGLFAISVQSKKKEEEAFVSLLPNTNEPNRIYDDDSVQYPLMDANNVLDRTEKLDHDNLYQGKAYTDKYFNVFAPENNAFLDRKTQQPVADGQTGGASARYTSLLGVPVDESYFQHQNMVPYFGGKIRQRTFDPNSSESLLDAYTGNGSQQTTKKAQSPLFDPEENLQWSYGMPNQNDFMQSRVNPSLRMANVKPFEEERVGPGLGLGYTAEGQGGFNSGLMDREAWMPKTVDSMRVANNPKAGGAGVYGYEGPADSMIKSMATADQRGRMEKYRPDTTFEVGSDRLLTTTGLEKGQTLRSTVVKRNITRQETGTEYVGAAHGGHAEQSLDGTYLPSKRQELGEVPSGVAGWKGAAGNDDYGLPSHKVYKNNRSSQGTTGYFGALSSAITAAVSPVLDVLRPSRKENTVGNLRLYGDAGATVSHSYVCNPNDRAPTTVRETTERSKFHMNINANQLGGAYKVASQQPAFTERSAQSDSYYAGGSSATFCETRAYDAEYRQHNNDIKAQTIQGRMQQGNASLFNNQMNIRAYDKAPQLEQTDRAPVPGRGSNVTPSVDSLGYLQRKPVIQQEQRQLDGSIIAAQLQGNPYALKPFAK